MEEKNGKYKNLSDLGFDLRTERQNRGLSQRTVAKMLGMSYQSYQSWENGLTKAVRPDNFYKLQDFFTVSEA